MSEIIELEVGDIHYQMFQQLTAIGGEEEIMRNLRKLNENEIHSAYQELQERQDQQFKEMEAQEQEQADENPEQSGEGNVMEYEDGDSEE